MNGDDRRSRGARGALIRSLDEVGATADREGDVGLGGFLGDVQARADFLDRKPVDPAQGEDLAGALGQALEGLDQEFVFLASGKGFGNARRII